MGKNLKGKELGTGLSQRQDGKFSARYVNKNGKRIQKYFDKIQEAKKWLNAELYNMDHGNISASSQMTVDAWFDYWITDIKGKTIKENSVEMYKGRYNSNIKEVLGSMFMLNVKPMHCQKVLADMQGKYKASTQKGARTTMLVFFESALENEIIPKNPVTKEVKITDSVGYEPIYMSISQQKMFLEASKSGGFYDHYRFILNTGVRIGELTGLKWSDLDFENKVIKINRTMYFSNKDKRWKCGETKSKKGNRSIPMTNEVCDILSNIKERRSKEIANIEFHDHVFLNDKGMPTKNPVYKASMNKIAENIGMETLSPHALRHTFATRCIESGMKPKTLQTLLGHSNISITMDLYVHTTEEETVKEMCNFETMCKLA